MNTVIPQLCSQRQSWLFQVSSKIYVVGFNPQNAVAKVLPNWYLLLHNADGLYLITHTAVSFLHTSSNTQEQVYNGRAHEA